MADNLSVLIVEDDSIDALFFKHALTKAGYEVTVAEGATKALDAIAVKEYGLMLVDLKMAEMDGIELLEVTKRYYPQLDVIIITAHASVDTAVEAMRRGACSYFVKGDPVDKLLFEVDKCYRFKSDNGADSVCKSYRLKSRGAQFSRLLKLGEQLGQLGENLLIVGPRGSGRRDFACHIHSCSKDEKGPFLEVDLSLMNNGLAHDRFVDFLSETLAVLRNSGTVYLRDVGMADPKVLSSFLHEVGENTLQSSFKSTGMIISSSVLKDVLVMKSRFGAELFFNYWALRAELPGLAERREDLPLFIPEICEMVNAKIGTSVDGVDKKLMNVLSKSVFVDDFLGLEELIGRLCREVKTGTLFFEHLERVDTSDVLLDSEFPVAAGEPISLKDVRERAESEHIQAVMDRTGGRKCKTAAVLGVSSRQLYNMLKKYGLG